MASHRWPDDTPSGRHAHHRRSSDSAPVRFTPPPAVVVAAAAALVVSLSLLISPQFLPDRGHRPNQPGVSIPVDEVTGTATQIGVETADRAGQTEPWPTEVNPASSGVAEQPPEPPHPDQPADQPSEPPELQPPTDRPQSVG